MMNLLLALLTILSVGTLPALAKKEGAKARGKASQSLLKSATKKSESKFKIDALNRIEHKCHGDTRYSLSTLPKLPRPHNSR